MNDNIPFDELVERVLHAVKVGALPLEQGKENILNALRPLASPSPITQEMIEAEAEKYSEKLLGITLKELIKDEQYYLADIDQFKEIKKYYIAGMKRALELLSGVRERGWSRDYEKLYEYVIGGGIAAGFIDNKMGGENIYRDICKIRVYNGAIDIGARGIGYFTDHQNKKEFFIKVCEDNNVEWIRSLPPVVK